MADVEGRVYLAPNGKWSWRVSVDGTEEAGGAGYDTKKEAETDMHAEMAEQERQQHEQERGID